MKKQVTICLQSIILWAFALHSLSASEILLDFTEGNHALLSLEQGAGIIRKEFSSTVALHENELQPRTSTDLLLNFNRQPLREKTGNYRITENRVRLLQKEAWRAEGSAIFQNEPSGLVLSPQRAQALFSADNVWKDFSIEFWLYPATAKDGEIVFLWRGVRWQTKDDFLSQEIRCSFNNRKLNWSFSNFFLPPHLEDFSISVTPVTALVPREWHHHQLSFDASTGRIEYLIDGVPEAIAYANPDNRETGEVFLPYTGRAAKDQIILGRSFTGFMDDFMITASSSTQKSLSTYPDAPGVVITKTLNLGHSQSRVTNIVPQDIIPEETAIIYSYRLSDETDTQGNPWGVSWQRLIKGDPLPPTAKGQYLQIRAQLFTDGSHDLSPQLNHLTIDYDPALPPPQPTGVWAENMNGEVKITWNPVPGAEIAGYKVYFGKEPGHYFGTDSERGNSPIDVGKTTETVLKGLTLNQIYYFSIVAYDSARQAHQSPFSREVSARPIRIEP